MNEEDLQLLRQRDDHIAQLLAALDEIQSAYAELAAQLASEHERQEAMSRIDDIRYKHGLRSGWGQR